jgi:putative hydrolase of the HAD superfamily
MTKKLNRSQSKPHTRPQSKPGTTLFLDADDTLWENSIYFETAIASFISCLDHQTHTPAQVREHLDSCELRTIAAHGYGQSSFRRSLLRCFEELSTAPLDHAKQQRIASFAEAILHHPIDLLPAVQSTLTELATRYDLFLVTKGNDAEQNDKLNRSGLRVHFKAVEVLHEKNAEAYRELIARHSCNAASTWMIGNSIKSDINPALAAGLSAVFIPHAQTWILEHEALDHSHPGRLLELPSFAALTDHF